MAYIDNDRENFLSVVLLLFEGCKYIVLEVLHRAENYEQERSGKDIETVLQEAKHKLKNASARTLFAVDGSKTQSDKWNISQITLVILTCYNSSLTQQELRAVETIRHVRNKITNSSDASLTREDYVHVVQMLENAINILAETFGKSVRQTCEELLQICSNYVNQKQSSDNVIKLLKKETEKLKGTIRELKEEDLSFEKRYEKIEDIGRGAFGTVIKARHRTDGTEKAVKKVTIKWTGYDHKLKEVEKLGQLKHTHIVQYHDSWTEKKHARLSTNEAEAGAGVCKKRYLYIVTELCDSNLETWLTKFEQKDISTIMRWFQQMISALVYMHEKVVVHRDLKPENILFLGENVKIADFGLATALGEDTLQRFQRKVKTKIYRSPEILNEKVPGRVKSAKVDIYSLGVILFDMLYKYRDEDERNELLSKLPEIPEKFSLQFPEEADLGSRMIKFNPVERPSAQTIQQELQLRGTLVSPFTPSVLLSACLSATSRQMATAEPDSELKKFKEENDTLRKENETLRELLKTKEEELKTIKSKLSEIQGEREEELTRPEENDDVYNFPESEERVAIAQVQEPGNSEAEDFVDQEESSRKDSSTI